MGRLDEVDLSQKLSRKEQDKRLSAAQERLEALRLQLAGLIGDGRLGPALPGAAPARPPQKPGTAARPADADRKVRRVIVMSWFPGPEGSENS